MDLGDFQRLLATTLRFSLTSRRVASIAHDVHTIATEMGRRPGVNMEEVLVRMIRVLGGLAEEPDSWRAEITNSFNREFTDRRCEDRFCRSERSPMAQQWSERV